MKLASVNHAIALKLLLILLGVLWFYTVADKLYNFDAYQNSMMNQVFNRPIAKLLVYLLPSIEWLTFCFLLFPKFRLAGLYLSAFLLFSFTLYVAFAVLGFYPKRPCSCGGLFRSLSWNAHLYLNVFLFLLSVTSIPLYNLRRKEVKGN